MEVLQQERRHVLAGDPPGLQQRQPGVQDPVVQGRVQLLLHGDRVGHHDRPVIQGQGVHGGDHAGDLLGAAGGPVQRVA